MEVDSETAYFPGAVPAPDTPSTWPHKQILWPWPFTSRAYENTPLVDYNGEEAFPKLPPQSLPLIASLNPRHIHPQFSSPLFRLSPEIRECVFNLALQTYNDPKLPYDRRKQHWRPETPGKRRVDMALLKTCRAIYRETWALPTLLTTLVVHQGSYHDRPPSRETHLLYIRPGQALFHLQAWQLLLLQHVEMTIQQDQLDQRGVEVWVERLGKARHSAKELVLDIARQQRHNDRAIMSATDFVERNLMNLGIKTLKVRINRSDWITSKMSPGGMARDLNLALERGQALDLTCPWPERMTVWNKAHVGDLFVRDGFEWTLVLETYGAKKVQLDRVVGNAKKWMVKIPKAHVQGQREKDGSTRMLVWDGDLRDESYQRVCREDDLPWLRQEENEYIANRVEVRVLRYIEKHAG